MNFDSMSKKESINFEMRSMSREFRDDSPDRDGPMENISTTLGESSRCSPRLSGEHHHHRVESLKTFGTNFTSRRKAPIGGIQTGKMNNYFKNG